MNSILANWLRKPVALFVAMGVGIMNTSALAASVIFTGSLPANDLSASVTFDSLGGGNLQVTLVNTYTGDTVDQSHILTAVFFSGANGLTPVAATAGAGSVEWVGTASSAPESSSSLGQQWEYLSGLSGAPGGATAGISSSGFGLFGKGNFAAGGAMLDGSAYGIISAGYAGGDQDGLGNRQYIQQTMVFDLSSFSGNLSAIKCVSFQYGTTLGSEPDLAGNLVQVPEPAPVALLTAFIGFLGLLRFRVQHAKTNMATAGIPLQKRKEISFQSRRFPPARR